jgi:hypothetical protein
MAGIGLLDGIHGECADGIDANLIDVARNRLLGLSLRGSGHALASNEPPRASAAVAEVLPDAVALSLMEHCIESGLDRAKRILART